MASTLSDKIVTEVAVTDAEFLTLLSQKAQDAGLINYVPDNVTVNPTSIPQPDVEGVPQPDLPGWRLTFTGPRA